MAGGAGGVGGCAWSRRVALRMRTLRGLVRDTIRSLDNVADILQPDADVPVTVQEIGTLASRSTALVILGRSASARVRLLHCLLGRQLLPEPMPRGCRWLRIQYGTSTQVHLLLGNSEFELVEELECNKNQWNTLPVEDLVRQDNTDLATMLEIELNNPFLKDGLKIIFPPDIETEPGSMSYKVLKQLHLDLYTKRDLLLKNFNPVYLYAIDKIGDNIFAESIGSGMTRSMLEEDFWSTYSFHSMSRVNSVKDFVNNKVNDRTETKSDFKRETYKEPAVLTGENCLDLHQVKEANCHSQVYFILFSDSRKVSGSEQHPIERDGNNRVSTSANVFTTEELPESDQGLIRDDILRRSQESPLDNRTPMNTVRLIDEQKAFMNDLLDQWEIMTNPPLKHYVKSQWVILDDMELLHSSDFKVSNSLPNANETNRCRIEGEGNTIMKSRAIFLNKILRFASDCMQSYLLEYCTRLSEIHVKLVQQFILASFELARELQVVPKKIQYVAKQEQHLFETINEKFSKGDKKQELVELMQEVLQEMRADVNNMDWCVDDLPCHQDKRFHMSNSTFYSSSNSNPVTPTEKVPIRLNDLQKSSVLSDKSDQSSQYRNASWDIEEAVSYDSYNFDDYDIIDGNEESLSVSDCYRNRFRDHGTPTSTPVGLIHVENEPEYSLSTTGMRSWTVTSQGTCSSITTCNTINMPIKQASLDVQQTVLSKLSRKISIKLVKFIDCLRDTYFGTLQRCLDTLESSCRQELGGRPASEAMRQLLSVARQVDLQPYASFSLLNNLMESLKRLFYKLRIGGSDTDGSCCVLSPVWRRQVALHTTDSLSPQRLARIISSQILERLSIAHKRYQSALTYLESALANRLHHTEDVKLGIRKKFAPEFARLCLESTSMCDLLMYGTPELDREIGRGQFGVVYSVRGSWGGHSPTAVKSVLPADERHYNELAMEFFYTRSIPAHPRIVRLLGSIVQRKSGNGPTVLLVSERKVRDLHTAVRAGLTLRSRMRISCDIVEGIRYLHSMGLVHRDIKMKNVLLDSEDRASLSDLGFCAAEALISGSVVGTPVHMAPELLAGDYDANVDVYAFGVLFWYVCAGNIKLPSAFAIFENKEQLWTKVKRGLRPERLPHFEDEWWEVMESCWASEPSQRALLGDIQLKLEKILEQTISDGEDQSEICNNNTISDVSDDDSMYMTGIPRRNHL